MYKEKFLKKFIWFTFMVFVFSNFITGCTENEGLAKTANESQDILTLEEFEKMYYNPNQYKYSKVDFYARVFTKPERTDEFISIQAYANNDDEKNIAIRIDNCNISIEKDNILHVVGIVQGEMKGTNLFGAELSIPAIIAESVEITDYITAFSPTIKEYTEIGYIEQNYVTMSIEKVELAEEETRVYVNINNKSQDTFEFYSYSARIIQDEKQFSTQRNYNVDYEEINSDIPAGVREEGVLLFEPINKDEIFKIVLKGDTYNFDVGFEDFIFHVPTKDNDLNEEILQEEANFETVQENETKETWEGTWYAGEYVFFDIYDVKEESFKFTAEGVNIYNLHTGFFEDKEAIIINSTTAIFQEEDIVENIWGGLTFNIRDEILNIEPFGNIEDYYCGMRFSFRGEYTKDKY